MLELINYTQNESDKDGNTIVINQYDSNFIKKLVVSYVKSKKKYEYQINFDKLQIGNFIKSKSIGDILEYELKNRFPDYREFEYNLKNLMKTEYYESNNTPDSETYINNLLREDKDKCMINLSKFFHDNYTDVHIAKGVLHIISHFEFEELNTIASYVAFAGLNHSNKSVRKYAIKAYDNWDNTELLPILKGMKKPSEKWLRIYLDKVISHLERKQQCF